MYLVFLVKYVGGDGYVSNTFPKIVYCCVLQVVCLHEQDVHYWINSGTYDWLVLAVPFVSLQDDVTNV